MANPMDLRPLAEDVGAEGARQVFAAFLETTRVWIPDLEASIARKDWPVAGRLAHGIAGSARTFLAHDLERAARDLEAAVAKRSVDVALAALGDVRSRCTDLENAAGGDA